MANDLLDAKAAIDWAISQIPVLTERIIAWKRDRPYAVRIDTDTEPGKKLYRLTDIKSVPPHYQRRGRCYYSQHTEQPRSAGLRPGDTQRIR